ncbi:SusD/RagB family nutrient-binding outer membrane lipoprotein [Chryseolinea sp. T2]|uniref:SusD/RagB family nutrient-binding outer membrane lipoprotein n=1 Tax=Chryseolinea sp. T2 TaxID=3129255 RepID=UPI0030775CB9
MKLNKRIGILSLAATLAVASGCDSYFDINVDPNNPSEVTLGQLLTQSEVTLVNSLGIGNNGMSTPTSILVHQTVQRGSVDQYVVSGDDFQITTSWQNLYSGSLEDLKTIIDQGTEEGSPQYVGVAQILTAYTYSMIVDMWGDVPFSAALNPQEALYPEYDDDAMIYPALLQLLDNGIANLAQASEDSPATDDVIYGGNLVSWRRLAKSLKLKLYNQTRLVADVSAQVNALIAEGDLLRSGADFELEYGTSVAPDNRNPAFVYEYTLGNKVSYISPYFYEIMTNQSELNDVLTGISDPRVPYYWFKQLTDPADAQNPTEYTDDNGFLSIHFASTGVNQGWQQDRSQTVLGLYAIGGRYDDGKGGEVNTSGAITGPGTVAQRLYTHFASLYTQAELVLTEPGVTGDHRKLFEDAIRASFAKVNAIAADAGAPLITAGAINTYVAAVLAKYDAANATGKLELILTEKWIASFGFSIDAYTDYRRTGFPVMYDPNTDDLPYTGTSRQYPVSMAYNSQSLTLNQNAPTQKNVTTDRIFWDAE